MSDISDLHGAFPTPFRWNAEHGIAGYTVWNEAIGERELKEIEFGSQQSIFAVDLATRERGYGRIRIGDYTMELTPVGSLPPPWPNDEDFKPAIGMWMWNQTLGELRLETNAALLVRAISGLWERALTFKEAAQGLEPIICFADRRERLIRSIGKTFFEPVTNIVGWVRRDQVPTFPLREPTVKPPPALPALAGFSALPSPSTDKEKSPGKRRVRKVDADVGTRLSVRDELDDELPL